MNRLLLLLAAIVGLPTLAAAQSPGEVVEYYHLDALGSVRAVTAQNGSVVRRHDFKPFGEEVIAPVPNPDRKLFTGHERDGETGFDYFGARYYWANLGRFTTVDPAMTLSENLPDPQRWNRYAYARDNPLRFTDPDGRAPQRILMVDWTGTATNVVELRREYNSSSGWAKAWAGLQLVIAEGALLPTPIPLTVVTEAGAAVAASEAIASTGARAGSFSIIDWRGYPAGVPKPAGPFWLLEGAEYGDARTAANAANRAIHARDASLAGMEIHEIQPVKLGGSPTAPGNKIALDPKTHSTVTSWWNRLVNWIQQ